ncbi:MAG: P-II family nitrogen regulator [Ignavibacteria bacterium]|nr:P-II family nitrogen regulator [Ignavibacteria bacterium]
MKEIKAIIRPFKLSDVLESLKRINGLPGLTVDRTVVGFGRSSATSSELHDVTELLEGVQKVRIEMVVPDAMVESVIGAIQEHAYTGNPGDGKIFVYAVEEVVKIRTKERGEKAI